MKLKILVAEDEKDVADTYTDILEWRGHDVVVTYSGGECLTEYLSAIQDKEKTPYDVVIIDHLMPDLNGARVAKKILEMNPRQRIIFVSGYGSDLLSNLSGISNIDFLTKPVVIEALTKLVEN
jgi:two-component system cell cycle response regulator CpdR